MEKNLGSSLAIISCNNGQKMALTPAPYVALPINDKMKNNSDKPASVRLLFENILGDAKTFA